MFHRCRRMGIFLFLAGIGLWLTALSEAQFVDPSAGTSFELSDTVQIDQVGGAVRAQLERIKSLLADRRWAEAVAALRQVMESPEEKLVAITEHRFVGLREYGNRQIAALPPEALQLYRGQVDPVAENWYRRGLSARNRRLLRNVVEQAFASRFGDDALLALGDLAFEAGDFDAARWHWERILPHPAPAGVVTAWPGYPDTDLDPGTILARLVLVSIFEGARDRAREELTEMARLHRDARGWLAGREGNFVEILTQILAESAAWPNPDGFFSLPKGEGTYWPTFAGTPTRNGRLLSGFDAGRPVWKMALPPVRWNWMRPVAEGAEPLSYHPVLDGQAVLVSTGREINALRLADGKPLWSGVSPVLYRDLLEGVAPAMAVPPEHVGAARFTLTVCENQLHARMGAGVAFSNPSPSRQSDYLVALDLKAQGRLLWKVFPEEGWAFDGDPVADGAGVYVAMRRIDIRPQAYVACFDPRSGRLRWRQFVCSAETPARGRIPECADRLLTLAGDSIYFSTNLGAVAALDKEDGRVRWISLYPRSRRGDLARLAAHWHRDLTPCVYGRGVLYAAPADSPRLMAFDAATGMILWHSGTGVEDVVHLLGVTDEHLIASGGRLYWIGLHGADQGRVKHLWPESPEKPGYGRGVLAAGLVVFPTRDTIYLFDQRTAQLRNGIELGPLGAVGGNVLPAGGGLLIATGSELMYLHPAASAKQREEKGPLAASQRR
ncbi:MAG: PQQ-binding-like beta-propeller repeat protein [Pirellulales bacterium]|nr:PQQ-binding-like beta-propeller repeat protein [Pirellulales bacterium]